MSIKYFEEVIYRGVDNRLKENFIKNNFFDFYEYINNNFDAVKFIEKLYIFYKGRKYCRCGSQTKFENFKSGYRTHCSKKCASNNTDTREKYKKTCVEKYGVENVSKNEKIKKKKELTNIRKFGKKTYLQTNDVKLIIKEKYGVDNPFQSEEIKEKIYRTNVEKYGFKTALLNNEIKDKSRKSILEKYGVDHYSKSENFKYDFKKLMYDKFINEFELIGYQILDKNGYTNYIKHEVCGEVFEIQTQLIRKRIKNNQEICMVCNQYIPSYFEKNLLNYIKDLNSNVISNYREGGLEIDIYLPELKLGFEYNGLYWHSELFKDKNYHLDKTNMFKKLGIKIYHIWEDDWKYKNEIIKSIISSKIDKTTNKIYARKCEIVEIDNKTSKKFLNENHLQGFCVSKYRIGLKYDNKLVSLITLGKKRVGKSEKNEYEILRFCNLNNHSVIGGFSKLLKNFINEHKPSKISTYADSSISEGELYLKNGFHYKYQTKPNYFYFKNSQRINRFNFSKKKLIENGFDKKKTEKEIMADDGYLRIYDCGSYYFEMVI